MGPSAWIAAAWIGLAAVFALGALWLRRAAPVGGMKVLARLPLEPRRALMVVDVAGRVLVLASSESGVSLLVELDPVSAAALAPTPAAAASRLRSLLLAGRRP